MASLATFFEYAEKALSKRNANPEDELGCTYEIKLGMAECHGGFDFYARIPRSVNNPLGGTIQIGSRDRKEAALILRSLADKLELEET